MAYKRYIRKNGKLYGPYIYKSIRDKNGNVKNIYVGKGKPDKVGKSKLRFFTLQKFGVKFQKFPSVERNSLLIIVIILVSLGGFFLFIQPTGFLVRQETRFRTMSTSWNVTETQQRILNLSAEPKSLSVSGHVVGNGSVRIYAMKNGNKYLIYERTPPKEGPPVTGMVVSEEESKDVAVDEEQAESLQVEQEMGDVQVEKDEQIQEISVEEEGADTGTQIEETPDIAGTGEEDTVGEEEVIEESKKEPEETVEPVTEENVTKPEEIIPEETEEVEITENITEQQPEKKPEENVTTEITEPIENITIPEEPAKNISINITEPIEPVEENITNITEPTEPNVTVPVENVTNVTYPTENITNVTEYNITENVTEENITENVTEVPEPGQPPVEIEYFENACIETCILVDFGENVTLLVEVENDTSVYIEEIGYTIEVIQINNPPRFVSDIPDIQINKSGKYILRLSDYFEDPDDDKLTYYSSQPDNITITILDSTAIIVPDKNFAGIRNATFYAGDGINITASNPVYINVTENITAPLPENITNISVNMPPVLINSIQNITIQLNQNHSLDISEYFSDPENDMLTYYSTKPNNITITISDSIAIIIPDKNFTGIQTAAFYASDGINTTASNLFQINVTENVTNITKEEVIQVKAEIGKPVEWIKRLKLPARKTNITIKVPKKAAEISINEISKTVSKPISLENITIKTPISLKKLKIKRLLKGLGEPKIEVDETIEQTEIIIEEPVQEIEVKYQTDAPEAYEENTTRGKRIIVTGPELGYENITTFTNIPESWKIRSPDKIKLYWIENQSQNLRKEHEFTAYDKNENGYIDYIEWVTPHLSDQSFEIIPITKAEHLDQDKAFISNIYAEVKTLDNVWSEPIYHNEYVRVTFKQNLTSQNDITTYVQNTQQTNTKIEVYYYNSTEKITEFPIITEERYHKIYLTGMQGKHDTFDLKIINTENNSDAYLEFDYIVDPEAKPGGETELRPQTCNAWDQGAGESCQGNYPNACGSGQDEVSCSDDQKETGARFKTTEGGYNLSYYNTSFSCDGVSIDSVEVCYEWAISNTENSPICVIRVDNDGDDSWVTSLQSTTVGTTDSGGCVDVTSNETWACSNFLGASGTRATIMAECNKSSDAGGPITFSLDLLYYNVTYSTGDTTDPTVNLNGPEDDYNSTSNEITFNCTASDNINLTNVALYGNWSNGWKANETNSSGINDTEYIFVKNVTQPNKYVWNCYACDNSSNCDFATSNRSFSIGGTDLRIWDETDSGMPWGDQTKYANDAVEFYANYTNATFEPLLVATCNIGINVSGGWSQYSMTYNATKLVYEYNYTSGFSASGTYNWNVTCNKTGYINRTKNDTVPIAVSIIVSETVSPNQTIVGSGDNITVYGHINYSNGTDITDADIGIYLNNTLLDGSNLVKDDVNSPAWWNYSWRYRRNLNLTESTGNARVNERIILELTDLTLYTDDCTKELRLVNTTGYEENIQVLRSVTTGKSQGSKFCKIAILNNNSASGSKELYLYYGNSEATDPGYADFNRFHDDFEDYNVGDSGSPDWTNWDDTRIKMANDSGNMVVNFSASGQWDRVLYTGNSNWENYTYEFDAVLKLYEDTNTGCGTYSRFDASSYKYITQFGLFGGGYDWILSKENSSGFVDVEIVTTYDISLDQWYHVQGNASGDIKNFYIDYGRELEENYYDSELDTGYIGLFAKFTTAYFDNFSVWEPYVNLYETPSSVTYGSEEYYLMTDSSGDYNYTFSAPSSAGAYDVKVNISYGISTGANTKQLEVIQPPYLIVNVTTNQSSYDQGDVVNASGTFFWSNGTKIANKNVTVRFYNTTNDLMNETNATTDSNGEYSEVYTLSPTADDGNWNVTVTGWLSPNTTSNSTTFIVKAPGNPAVGIISPVTDDYCFNVSINASVFDSEQVSTVYYKVSNATSTVIDWTAMNLGSGTNVSGYWNATLDTATITGGSYNVTINATDSQGNYNSTENKTFNITSFQIIWNDNDDSGTDSFNDTVQIYNSDLTITFRYQNINTAGEPNGYSWDRVVYKGETLVDEIPYYDQDRLWAGVSDTNLLRGVVQLFEDPGSSPDIFQELWSAEKTYHNLYSFQEITSKGCVLRLYSNSRTIAGMTLTHSTNFTLSDNRIKINDSVQNTGGSSINLMRFVTFPGVNIIDTLFHEPENRNNYPYGDALYIRGIGPVAYSDNYTAGFENYGSNGLGSGTIRVDAHLTGNPPWSDVKSVFVPTIYVLNLTESLGVNEKSVINVDIKFNDTDIETYYDNYLSDNNVNFDSFDYDDVRNYFTNETLLNQSFETDGYVKAAYYYDRDAETNKWGFSDWQNVIIGKSLMTMYYDTGNSYYLDKTLGVENYLINSLRHDEYSGDWRYGYFKDATMPLIMTEEWYKGNISYMWSQPYQLQGLIAYYMETGNSTILSMINDNIQAVWNGGLWNDSLYRWKWEIKDNSTHGTQAEVDDDNFDSQIFGINHMAQAYMFTQNQSYLDRAEDVLQNHSTLLTHPQWQLEDTRKALSHNIQAFAAKTLYLMYDLTGNSTYKEWANDILDQVIYAAVYMEPMPDEYTWLKGGMGRMSHDWENPSVPDMQGDSGSFAQHNQIPWLLEALVQGYKHTGNERYLNFTRQLLLHQKASNEEKYDVRMIDFFESSSSWPNWNEPADCTVALSTATKQMDSSAMNWTFTQSGGLTGDRNIYRTVSGSGTNGFKDWDEFSTLSFWFYTPDSSKEHYLSLKNSGSWVLNKQTFKSQLSSGAWSFVNITLPASRGSVEQINFTITAGDWGAGTYEFFIDDLQIRNTSRNADLTAAYNTYTGLFYDYDHGQGMVSNLFAVTEVGTFINESRVEESELLLMDRGCTLELRNPFNNRTFNATLHVKNDFQDAWNNVTYGVYNLNSVSLNSSDIYFIGNLTVLLNRTQNTTVNDSCDNVINDQIPVYINQGNSVSNSSDLLQVIDSDISNNLTLDKVVFEMNFSPLIFNYSSRNGNYNVENIQSCGSGTCFESVLSGENYTVTLLNITVESGAGNNITHAGGFVIADLPAGINILDESTESQNLSNSSQSGTVAAVLKKGSEKIARMDVLFNQDLNWSDILADVGNDTEFGKLMGKSLFYINTSTHTEVSDLKLFIPVKSNTGFVYICPNATTLADVNESCPYKYYEYVKNVSGYYNITVTGTGSVEGTESNLTIWDDNDPEGGSKGKETGELIYFFANYTNKTSGESITGSSIECNITFKISGSYTTWKRMAYNLTSELYESNKTFYSPDTYNWNVTCNDSSGDYDNLTTNDTITVNGDTIMGYCQFLSSANTIYKLNQSVTTTGTCFNITADNITLDGNGYNMTGDYSGTKDYGVNATDRLNLTIRNFGNISGFTRGIYFNNTNESLIENNTFSSSLAATTYAIYLLGSVSNSIENNTIDWNATGSGKMSHGVYLYVDIDNLTVKNNNVTNNSLTIYSANSVAYGVYLYGGAANVNILYNTINNNTFDVNASSTTYGLYFYGGAANVDFLYNTINNNNLTIYSASSNTYGVSLYTPNDPSVNISFNTINNNNLTIPFSGSDAYGVRFYAGNESDNISFNTINNNNLTISSSSNAIGIYLEIYGPSNSNIMQDNTLDINGTAFVYGVYLIGYQQDSSLLQNTVSHNTIDTNSSASISALRSYGLAIDNANYTNAGRNTINAIAESAMSAGIYLNTNSDFGRFWNNTVTDGNYSLYIDSGGRNNFMNNTFKNAINYEIYDVNRDINYLLYNNTFGYIDWTNTSDGPGYGFLRDLTTDGTLQLGNTINITDNWVEMNPSDFSNSKINSSGNITFYGTPGAALNKPVILRNGVECDSTTTPSCYKFTTLDAATVKFNISEWSNYTIGDATSLTACKKLNRPNTVYTLKNNVSTTGTCFSITAKNVTLDCQNWSNRITYGNSAAAATYSGVYVDANYDVATIKKCEIRRGGLASPSLQRYGIFLNTSDNGTIKDVNTSINRRAIHLFYSKNNTLRNITANFNKHGIYLDSSPNNTFANLSAWNGTTAFVYLYNTSHNNTFDDGYLNKSSNYGIWVDGASNSDWLNNTMFRDMNAENIYNLSVYLQQYAWNTTFLNVTYENESVGTYCSLIRKWYVDVNVSNSTGDPLPGANVTASNSSGVVFSELTGSDGRITTKTSTQYINESGTTTYFTPYTITVNKSGYWNYSTETSLTDNVWLDVTLGEYSEENVSGCIELNVPYRIYTLNESVSTTGTCFNITADYIILDGNGSTLQGDYDTGNSDYGINATGRLNLTIKNFGNISGFAKGIYFNNTNGSLIQNSTFSSSLGATTEAIYLEDSDSNSINGNTVDWNASGADKDSYGIYLTNGADYGNFWNNTVTDGNYSLYIDSTGGHGNTFTNNTFKDAINYEIYDDSGTSDTNYLFYNNTYGNINWTNSTNDGFQKNLSTKGTLQLGNTINITDNNVSMNPSDFTQSMINSSGNITFYGTPAPFVKPIILRNGVECDSTTTPSCYNFTALDAATVKFNISEWSSYSIGEEFTLTSCWNLNTPNYVYTLQNSVTTTGTCFNITADNITLDGNGYNMTGDYDTSNPDYGINASDRLNLTITNFGNISGFVRGIYFSNTNESLIDNNTFSSSLGATTYAIYLEDTDSNRIDNNTIDWNASGAGKQSHGVYLYANTDSPTVKNNNVTNNSLTIYSAASYAYGVYLLGSSYTNISYNTVKKNSLTIYSAALYAYGVYLHGAVENSSVSYNTVNNNNLTISSPSSATYGVYLYTDTENSSVSYNTVNNNNLTASAASYAYGVCLYGANTNADILYNTVKKNSLTIYSAALYAYGVYLYGSSYANVSHNTVSHNTIDTNSSASISALRSYGLAIDNANYTNAGRNTINAIAESAMSAGIYLNTNSDFGRFWNNTVTDGNYSLYIQLGGKNAFRNNAFSGAINYEIYDVNRDINYMSYNNTFGNINWTNTSGSPGYGFLRDLTTDGTLQLGNTINITGNWVEMNPSDFSNSMINSSGDITFYGTPGAALNKPVILRNGVECNSGTTPSCWNFTSLKAATVKFNISWWSNYSIGEGAPITSCQNLDTANEVYYISGNIQTTGTCFNITADNITLDGNGKTLQGDYDTSSSDYGINASDRLNITIQNFGNISGFVRGIYFNNVNESNITNNTFSSSLGATTEAIYLEDTDSDRIENNTIDWNSTGGATRGIRLEITNGNTAGNNNITNNSIIIGSDTSDTAGIRLYVDGGTSNNNIIQNNTIYINGTSANGIFVSTDFTNGGTSNYQIIRNNYLGLNSSSGTIIGINIIDWFGSTYSTIENNIISSTSTYSSSNIECRGLGLVDSDNTNITYNSISCITPNAKSAGIHLDDTYSTDYSNFFDNTVTGGNYSLYIGSGTGNTFTNNTFSGAINYEIYDASGTSDTNYLFFNNTYGNINWTNSTNDGFQKNLSTKGSLILNGDTGTVNITNNSVVMDPSDFTKSRINSKANITLYGMADWTFTNPIILRDGVECNSGTTPSCYNFTSLTVDTVIFNVSAWSNYSIGEKPTNTAPNTVRVILNATNDDNTTIRDLKCYAEGYDDEQTQLNAHIIWYNGTLKFNQSNQTITNGTFVLVSTLSSDYTNKTEVWNCSVKMGDFIVNESAWSNDTITILNTPPAKVVLHTPANDSSTTDRTQEFAWYELSDADEDTLIYELNITCTDATGGNCPDNEDREYNVTSGNCTDSVFCNFSIPDKLNRFGDDNYYYNWTVRAHDGDVFGSLSNLWNFTLNTNVTITLYNNSVEFVLISIGESNDTTDNKPNPFRMRNDGNCFIDVNITVEQASDYLWDSVTTPSQYYQYKVDNVTIDGYEENGSYNSSPSATQVTWANIPDSNETMMRFLNYSQNTDEAEIDLKISVPPGEGPGLKSSGIYFYAWYRSEYPT